MADNPTDNPTDNIDVTSFTSQIQSSIAADLLPDLQSVSDLSKQFGENLIEANSSANIDITGFDNIQKMQNSLSASQKSLTHFEGLAKNYRLEIANANDLTEMRVIIADQESKIAQTIQNAQNKTNKLAEETLPDLTKQVEVEQAKLNLISKGTDAYNVQKELLTSANEELNIANATLANNVGVITSMNKFQDEFLQGQHHMVNNAADFTSAQFDVRQSIGGVISETNDLLKVNQQLQEEVQGYGDQMQNFMKNYGPMVDDVMNGFDKIGDSITGTLDQIPLIGGLLSKYASEPLGEAADIAKNAFGGAMKESFKIMEEGGSATDAIAGGMSSFVNGLSGLGSALSKLLSGPFLLITAIAGLLFLAFKRFGELEEAARDFRKEVGGTLDAVRPIVDEVRRVNVEFAHMGVSLDDGFKAASALTDKFGTFGLKVMPGAIEAVALLSTQLGVTDANAAGAMEKFRMMGVAAGESANNMTLAVASAANLAGVNADEVMADIAGASEDALIFMGQTPGALAAAAVKAKQLGTSLNDVASTMESMLDFEGSMNKEMQLSSMLGSHISMDRLRQLSFAGDAEGVMKEQSRLLKSMGGLENMNVFQKKAAAEALGTSVENLMKMEQSEKDQAAFRAKFGGEAIALEKELEALRGGETKDAATRIKLQMEEQVQQEKMNQLKNEFNSMMLDLGEKLIPMVEVAMEAIGPILRGIAITAKFILMPFQVLGDIIAGLKGDWTRLGKTFQDSPIQAVLGTIIGSLVIFKTKLFGLGPLLKNLTVGFYDMSKGILKAFTPKSVQTFASSIKNKLMSKLPGAGGSPAGGSPVQQSTAATKTTAKSKAPKTPKGGKGLGMISKFNQIDMKQVLKGAAALVILAAAIWVSAKAFQEFAKVEWESVGKGTVVLGAMTAAAVALGNVGSQVMKGAFAIGVLGIALIPAAYAFGLFAGVSWSSVFTAIGAISLLAVVAGILGAPPIIGFVLAGALAIGALGLAMIPFAVAAVIAGYAAGLVADAFVKMAGSLSELTLEQVGVIFALGGAFAFLGMMFPFIVAGAVALGAVTFALLAFGVASNVIAPGIDLLAAGFDSFAVSLSKISIENVLAFGALGVTFAGFALLLPAIAVGAVTVGIMAWSIGKLGDAAGEAAPGINSFAEGLNPVIDKMLMISEASEKMRDASRVIREVGGAMASLGAGQAAQAAGGVMASAGGLIGGAIDFASDSLFGTENVEKNKEGPIDKMIRLGESMGNLQGIDGTLQNVRSAVESFTDINIFGLSSLSGGIKLLVKEMGSIDVSSLSGLNMVGDGIDNVMNSIGRVSEETISPIKALLYCISDANMFSVAVSGFNSLTDSIIKFGEALDNISLMKLALLGLVSKTDEAEKKLSEQPEIAEVVSKTEGSASVPTPTTKIAKVIPTTDTTSYSDLSPIQQLKQTEQFANSKNLTQRQGNLLNDVGGVEQVKKLKELIQERTFTKMQNDAMDGKSTAVQNQTGSSVRMGNVSSVGRDMKALFEATGQGKDSSFQRVVGEGMSFSAEGQTAISETMTNVIESDTGTANAAAGFELPSPATRPSVTETLATVNQPNAQAPATTTGTTTDTSTTDAKLAELIGLMKSGGISVYLDSKKVSKGLAAAAED